MLMSSTAKLSVQGLSRGQAAGYAPSWLSYQSPEHDSLPFLHTSVLAQPLKKGSSWDAARPALLLRPGLAGRTVCLLSPSLPTLGAPHLNPHSQAFPQPGITSPSYPDLVAQKEQIDLGTQCNLLIPSGVPLPQHYHTHTVERDARVWAGTKPRPRQKYIYNYIHICFCREEKLGV